MIKKLKDVFYDLNDILVAMIIIAAALLVIVINIDSILAYPSDMAAEIQTPVAETPVSPVETPSDTDSAAEGDAEPTGDPTADPVSDPPDPPDVGANENIGGSQGDPVTPDPATEGGAVIPSTPEAPTAVSITIAAGSTENGIADILIEAGLIADRQEFNQAVAAAGVGGRLLAGNFSIPTNATPTEIVALLTR
jgi:hypothetical protein